MLPGELEVETLAQGPSTPRCLVDFNLLEPACGAPYCEGCKPGPVCGPNGTVLVARRYGQLQPSMFMGAVRPPFSAVVWGGRRHQMLDAIHRAELASGLPSPQIGGTWAKSSPDIQLGYLFLDVVPASVNQTAAWANASGMRYVMLNSAWYITSGHYNVSVGAPGYWGGMAGLKQAVGWFEAHGVKVGMHTMSAHIDTRDSYVTPVPDPRLGKTGNLRISSALSVGATSVATVTATAHLPTPTGPLASACCDMQIGNEVITYSAVEPSGLSGVQRGAYGTVAAAHPAGTPIYLLTKAEGMCCWPDATGVWDPDGTLVDEIGANLARVYDEAGFSQIYFDGNECQERPHGIGAMAQAFWRHVKRDVLSEGSAQTPYTWHLDSRGGTTDYSATACRAWFDHFKSGIVVSTQQKLLTAQVGWWGFMYHSLAHYATTPDELEYMGARAAAYDAAPSLETRSMMLTGNGRTMEALAKVRTYLELDLPAAVKAQMRAPDMDFLLSKNASGFWITPARSHPPRTVVALDPDSQSWSIPTAFPTEPVADRQFGLRVRALAATDAEKDHAVDLLMVNNHTIERTAGHMVVTSDSAIPGGALKMALTSDCKDDCVASCSTRYTTPFDLTGRRQLSLRVQGDGSGTVLIVQLQTVANQYRDFLVELNFTGVHEINLLVPAGHELFQHRGGEIPTNIAMSMREFDWTQVIQTNIYVTAAPTGAAGPVIMVSELLARKELPGVIGGGSIQIGDNLALMLPGGVLHGSGCTNRTLACNVPPCNVSGCADYMEFEESSNVSRFFDANGYQIHPAMVSRHARELQTDGAVVPGIEPAGGEIHVRVKLSSMGQANAEVTIVEKSTKVLGPFRPKGIMKTDDNDATATPAAKSIGWFLGGPRGAPAFFCLNTVISRSISSRPRARATTQAGRLPTRWRLGC